MSEQDFHKDQEIQDPPPDSQLGTTFRLTNEPILTPSPRASSTLRTVHQEATYDAPNLTADKPGKLSRHESQCCEETISADGCGNQCPAKSSVRSDKPESQKCFCRRLLFCSQPKADSDNEEPPELPVMDYKMTLPTAQEVSELLDLNESVALSLNDREEEQSPLENGKDGNLGNEVTKLQTENASTLQGSTERVAGSQKNAVPGTSTQNTTSPIDELTTVEIPNIPEQLPYVPVPAHLAVESNKPELLGDNQEGIVVQDTSENTIGIGGPAIVGLRSDWDTSSSWPVENVKSDEFIELQGSTERVAGSQKNAVPETSTQYTTSPIDELTTVEIPNIPEQLPYVPVPAHLAVESNKPELLGDNQEGIVVQDTSENTIGIGGPAIVGLRSDWDTSTTWPVENVKSDEFIEQADFSIEKFQTIIPNKQSNPHISDTTVELSETSGNQPLAARSTTRPIMKRNARRDPFTDQMNPDMSNEQSITLEKTMHKWKSNPASKPNAREGAPPVSTITSKANTPMQSPLTKVLALKSQNSYNKPGSVSPRSTKSDEVLPILQSELKVNAPALVPLTEILSLSARTSVVIVARASEQENTQKDISQLVKTPVIIPLLNTIESAQHSESFSLERNFVRNNDLPQSVGVLIASVPAMVPLLEHVKWTAQETAHSPEPISLQDDTLYDSQDTPRSSASIKAVKKPILGHPVIQHPPASLGMMSGVSVPSNATVITDTQTDVHNLETENTERVVIIEEPSSSDATFPTVIADSWANKLKEKEEQLIKSKNMNEPGRPRSSQADSVVPRNSITKEIKGHTKESIPFDVFSDAFNAPKSENQPSVDVCCYKRTAERPTEKRKHCECRRSSNHCGHRRSISQFPSRPLHGPITVYILEHPTQLTSTCANSCCQMRSSTQGRSVKNVLDVERPMTQALCNFCPLNVYSPTPCRCARARCCSCPFHQRRHEPEDAFQTQQHFRHAR